MTWHSESSNKQYKTGHSSTRRDENPSDDEGPENKYKRFRERNNYHVKNSRKKKTEKEHELQKIYEQNEKRIEHLQKVAKDLRDELMQDRKPSSSSQQNSSNQNASISSEGKQNSSTKKSSKTQNTDSRPPWFGEPF